MEAPGASRTPTSAPHPKIGAAGWDESHGKTENWVQEKKKKKQLI